MEDCESQTELELETNPNLTIQGQEFDIEQHMSEKNLSKSNTAYSINFKSGISYQNNLKKKKEKFFKNSTHNRINELLNCDSNSLTENQFDNSKSSIKPYYTDQNSMKSDSYGYTSIILMKKRLKLDFINKNDYISRSEHKNYYFTCGEVECIESLNSISDHNNETILITTRWVIAEKYKALFSDKNLLLVKNRKSINFEEFKKIVVKQGFILHNYVTQLGLPEKMKIEKNIDEELEKVLALAIKFYTGNNSESINRRIANLIYSCFTNDVETNEIIGIGTNQIQENKNFYETQLIGSYLYSALSLLPFYWGYCWRSVDLLDEDLEIYIPGRIICWTQFSSCTKSENIEGFDNRNTKFHIYSQTGRDIEHLSRMKKEKEVLFLPFSQFLVHKVENLDQKNQIWLKQIELGIGELNILWVDDKFMKKHGKINQSLKIHLHIQLLSDLS